MAFFGRNQYLQNTDIPVYSAGDQPVQHPFTQQLGGLTKFGIGAAGLIAVGQFQFAPNYRGWDAIIQTVRAIEEYSPGQILRTFNLSAMLSPLESASRQFRYFSPDAIRRLKLSNYEWIADLNRLGIDISSSQVMEQGFRFEGGQLLLGKTGKDVLLPYAGIVRNPVGGTPLWQEAGARSLAGGPLNVREAFTSPIQFETATGEASEEVFKFIGGRSRSQVAGRYLSATGTAFVERFNRLVKDPFSFLGENRVASKIGEMLGVEASSGLKTFGKLGLKLGIALPAAFLGYNELDYWVRQSGILPNGITGTAIKMWQGLNVGISQIAEWTGLHVWREKQEEIAPGSTTLKKLMAFPIVGALTMGGLSYGARIGRQAIHQIAGLSLEQASLAGRYREAFIQQALYKTEVPSALKIGLGEKTIGLIEKSANQSLASVRGKIAFKVAEMQERKGILGLTKYLGKMSLTKASVLTGAAAGLLAVAPFIPGALVPSKRPDELRKIYSGEQLVPIRKGRFWLAGRSAYEGKRIQSYVPHWSVRYLSHARDIGTYGEDISPLQQFYRKNMTYDIETLHYFDRPYPQSSQAFEEVPLIGPILSATLGRIVKPARLMHLDVMGKTPTGELGYPEQAPRVGDVRPSIELGGLPAGTPISPYGFKGTIGEQVYRATEEIGLPGFALTSLKERITGSPDVFDQEMQLQSAVDIASMQRNYWEEELGDILGFCFVKGTKITTIDGQKNIEEIKIGDLVRSKDDFRKVNNISIRKLGNDKLLKVYGFSKGFSFICTENHHIPIIRRHFYNSKSEYRHPKPFENNNYDFIEIDAKQLRKGDFLLYPINQIEQNFTIDLKDAGRSHTKQYIYLKATQEAAECFELLEKGEIELNKKTRSVLRNFGLKDKKAKDLIRQFKNKNTPGRNSRYIEINEDIAYAIGWYIAEGCVDNGKLQFTLHSNEINYAKKLLKIFNNLGYNGLISIKNNTLVLRIYSSSLSRYFEIFGVGAHNKHIPTSFKNLPKSILKYLVEGLVEGDGWSNIEKGIGFTSSSKQLVIDLFDCLLKLGIPSNIYLDHLEIPNERSTYPQGSKRKETKRSYLKYNKGKEPWRFFNNCYLIPINKIEEIENPDKEQLVYDLEIEDIHYYIANNIMVHNSESFRRLVPHRRNQIAQWNEIPNTLAGVSWIPGAGDYSPNFQVGDPFCVTEDTLIETYNGLKLANEIYHDDLLKTHIGNWKRPSKIIKRKMLHGEKLYQIAVASCFLIQSKLSENHPVLITRNSEKTQIGQLSKNINSLNKILSFIKEKEDTCLQEIHSYFDYIDIKKLRELISQLRQDKKIIRHGRGLKKIKYQDSIFYKEEDLLNWIPVKDIKVGDYLAYPIPKLKDLVSYDTILDLSKYTSYPATDKYIYICKNKQYNEIIEYLEENNKEFAWGERKKILLEKKWDEKTFDAAKNLLKRKGIIRRIPRFINPNSKEWGIISGYYLSEGYCSNDSLIFAFNANETEFHQELLKAIDILFGLKGKIYYRKGTNECTVNIGNKILAEIIPNIFGKYFDKKYLSSKNCWIGSIKDLLRTIINGDGSYFIEKKSNDKKPRLTLKLVNPLLLYYIRQLLLALGYISYISNNNLIVRGQDAINVAKFLKTKFVPSSKIVSAGHRTFITEKYVYVRLEKKQEIDPVDFVYGFEIDQDDSFCVAGFATHNTKIPLGEWRIPGETYFQLHPRLRNIPLEKWPVIDKLRVLGDIAPYSDKYKAMLIQARTMKKTPEEQEQYKEIIRQVAEKKKTKEFYEYKYKTPARTEVQKLLADSNESEKTVKPGFLGSLFGKYWETIAHGIETPMEYLTPLSPGAKLVHMRTAVEDYERTQVFGKEAGFWQHPIEDFLKPFTRSLLASAGDREIPTDIQRKRNIQQYFDVLKYVKFTKLRNEALEFNNQELAQEYEEERKTTLTGVNVFSQNFSRMFKALPRSERDYFTAFSEADLEERQKILELVPESEKDLYSARWFIQDINDMRKAKEKGLLNAAQEAKLERSLETLYKLQAAEGYDITDDLISSYNNEKEQGESYGDWYRRTKVIPAKTENLPLPGPDWIGYHPEVDLDLVKAKLLDNLGESPFEYDIWPEQQRLVARSPYLEEAVEELEDSKANREDIKKQLKSLLASHGIRNARVDIIENSINKNRINIKMSQDRKRDIQWMKQKGKINV